MKSDISPCLTLYQIVKLFKNCQIIRGLKSRSKTVQINNSYDYIHKKLLEVSDGLKKVIIYQKSNNFSDFTHIKCSE